MRAVIIGAGRGSRLGPNTEEIPKTLVPVMGRPMLDWILDALAEAGFGRRDVVFVCGYRQEVVRARYPEFTFVENRDWPHNNILASLLCARDHLTQGFVSTYADIVYDGAIASAVAASPHDITLGVDVNWRRRYVQRSQHPESDAEKVRADQGRIVELSRTIPSDAAQGEFIGVMKMSAAGAATLTRCYDELALQFAGKTFREGRSFEKAYLIDALQHLVEGGTPMHCATTRGAYMEIDTEEDLGFAAQWWAERPR